MLLFVELSVGLLGDGQFAFEERDPFFVVVVFFGVLMVFEGLESSGVLEVFDLLVPATQGISVPLRLSCRQLC